MVGVQVVCGCVRSLKGGDGDGVGVVTHCRSLSHQAMPSFVYTQNNIYCLHSRQTLVTMTKKSCISNA